MSNSYYYVARQCSWWNPACASSASDYTQAYCTSFYYTLTIF